MKKSTNNWFRPWLYALAFMCLVSSPAYGQRKGAHFDESRVPKYSLPPVLTFANGEAVTRQSWGARRREMLRLFEDHVYGQVPGTADSVRATLRSAHPAFDGVANMEQYRLNIHVGSRSHPVDLLLYVPAKGTGPHPTLIAMNFYGNHTVRPDTNILLTDTWLNNNLDYGPAYELFGLTHLTADTLPPIDEANITSHVGYHLRSGGHDVKPYDWARFLDFADFHFGR